MDSRKRCETCGHILTLDDEHRKKISATQRKRWEDIRKILESKSEDKKDDTFTEINQITPLAQAHCAVKGIRFIR